MSWHVKVIANRYADSVKLMGIARALRGRDGVEGCEMGMGTAANLEALAARGVEAQAGPSDLIVAVQTDSDDVAQETIEQAEAELSSGGGRASIITDAASLLAAIHGDDGTWIEAEPEAALL